MLMFHHGFNLSLPGIMQRVHLDLGDAGDQAPAPSSDSPSLKQRHTEIGKKQAPKHPRSSPESHEETGRSPGLNSD